MNGRAGAQWPWYEAPSLSLPLPSPEDGGIGGSWAHFHLVISTCPISSDAEATDYLLSTLVFDLFFFKP